MTANSVANLILLVAAIAFLFLPGGAAILTVCLSVFYLHKLYVHLRKVREEKRKKKYAAHRAAFEQIFYSPVVYSDGERLRVANYNKDTDEWDKH